MVNWLAKLMGALQTKLGSTRNAYWFHIPINHLGGHLGFSGLLHLFEEALILRLLRTKLDKRQQRKKGPSMCSLHYHVVPLALSVYKVSHYRQDMVPLWLPPRVTVVIWTHWTMGYLGFPGA